MEWVSGMRSFTQSRCVKGRKGKGGKRENAERKPERSVSRSFRRLKVLLNLKSLSLQSPCRRLCSHAIAQVVMAQGDGKGVGHVWRFGEFGEAEFALNGALDLPFRRATGTGQNAFDLRGGAVDPPSVLP